MALLKRLENMDELPGTATIRTFTTLSSGHCGHFLNFLRKCLRRPALTGKHTRKSAAARRAYSDDPSQLPVNTRKRSQSLVNARKRSQSLVNARERSQSLVNARERSQSLVNARERSQSLVNARKRSQSLVNARKRSQSLVNARKRSQSLVNARKTLAISRERS